MSKLTATKNLKKTSMDKAQPEPTVEAVTSASLADFRMLNGFTGPQMVNLFALSTLSQYNELVPPLRSNDAFDLSRLSAPLRDRSVALLYRAYTTHPVLLENIKELSMNKAFEMFLRVYGARYIKPSTFSVLLGRSASRGARWLERDENTDPQVKKILLIMKELLASGMSEVELCKWWVEVARKEAISRREIFIFDELDLDKKRITDQHQAELMEAFQLARVHNLDVRAYYYGSRDWDTYFARRAEKDGFDPFKGITTALELRRKRSKSISPTKAEIKKEPVRIQSKTKTSHTVPKQKLQRRKPTSK